MATTILQKENEVLRKKVTLVEEKDFGSTSLKGVIADMKEALATQEDGVAIAAPQIGESLAIFVISGKILSEEEDGDEERDDMVFINPEITKISKKKEVMDEGCLSVRWKYGKVERSKKATIQALNEKGEKFTYSGSGLLAQIFQHETDHLKGVLFTDKATDLVDIKPEDHGNT